MAMSARALRLHERLFRVRDGRGTCARWADGRFLPTLRSFRRGSLERPPTLTGCFLCRSRTKANAGRYAGEALNLLASFRWARGMTVVAALMAVFIMQLVGQVPAALWVIFGEDRFHWDATTIGISLAAFGILHSLAQAMITGPSRPARRKAGTHARNDCRRHRLHPALPSRHGDGWRSRSWSCLLRVASECRRCKQCCPQVDEERQGSCKAHWRRSPA